MYTHITCLTDKHKKERAPNEDKGAKSILVMILVMILILAVSDEDNNYD